MSCVPVEVKVDENGGVELDEVAFGVVFFVGMLIGAALFLCIGWLCIRDIKSRRDGDPEKEQLREEDDVVGVINPSHSRPTTAKSTKSTKKKRLQSGKRKNHDDNEPLVPITVANVVEVKPKVHAEGTEKKNKDKDKTEKGKHGGMVEALVHSNSADMEVEIAGQDVEAVESLDRELKAESIMTGIQILRSLLGQQLRKGKMSEEQYKDMMRDAQQNISDIMHTTQQEQQDEEQEIDKTIKDPAKSQAAKDALHGKYASKMNGLLAQEKEKLRAELNKRSDLSEEEIEALLAAYTNQMAHLENKLASERARKAANLEERLARRKYLAGMQNIERKQQRNEIENRKETNEHMLQSLVTDGKMNDKQKEELLKQYDSDVMRLQNQHELEFEQQRKKLAEKLRKQREQKMQKLAEEQEAEKEDFVKRTEQAQPTDVVNQYHAMLAQQREQRAQLSDDLDQQETQDITDLLKEQDRQKRDELEKKEEEFQKKLKSQAGISETDMRRLMDIHEQEMAEYERIKKNDKKKMKAALEEKLAERKRKAEEQLAQNEAEQVTVREQQDETIKKVIESQKELPKDARDEILQEHDRNMTAMQNQLQMSKLRQQKIMEQKMAARRAKVEDLKAKQDDIARNKRQYKEAERNKLHEQLEKQIAEEEARIEKERKDMLNEMRQRMAKETEQALAEQEKQMSALIGRLQVGQARRLAIISKQDKTLKELENKVQAQVEGDRNANSPTENAQVDYLLKQHGRDVEELNEHLEDAKHRQQMNIRDKLEAKKAKKEREVEQKISREMESGNRGALISTNILQRTMLEQRHKMEIKRLEKEMELEMQKQREQLNEQLEQELQEELESRKKNFLAQIAAIKGMSKAEVNQLVDEAVIDTGGDEKEAKKLRKEMNSEITRAKTELGIDDREMASMRRTKTGFDDSFGETDSRPKSGKKKRPKSAFKGADDEF